MSALTKERLDAGRFARETHAAEIAALSNDFLARHEAALRGDVATRRTNEEVDR